MKLTPTPSFVVSVAALTVALGGTSAYAYDRISSADIRDDSVRSVDVKNGTLRVKDIAPMARRALEGDRGPRGVQGPRGPQGPQGEQGPAGVGRWLLVDAAGQIEAQSGGFEIRSAYDVVNNTGAAIPAGAVGNVYIDANEDLSDNGIVVTLALQNQVDQNGDMVMNGRAAGPDANPEFSGEVTATMCAITGVVGCAPTGANTVEHLVVSPRLSDGQSTDATNRKRFYVVVTGDSSDYVAPTPG